MKMMGKPSEVKEEIKELIDVFLLTNIRGEE
jgi:hypothetical protein